MHPAIVEARRAKSVYVLLRDKPWCDGQHFGVCEHCHLLYSERQRIQRIAADGRNQLILQLNRCVVRRKNPPEPRSVMVQSIPTAIQRGTPHRYHLTKPTWYRPLVMHEGPIEDKVRAHGRGMYGVDLDDVIRVVHALVRREVRCGVWNKRHGGAPYCGERRAAGEHRGHDDGDPGAGVSTR